MSASSVDASREEQRLYDLIYKRTLASQMADAKLDKTVAKISVSGRDEEWFVARGEVITFEGFLKLYLEGTDDEDGPDETTKDMLPAMTEGQSMDPRLGCRHPALQQAPSALHGSEFGEASWRNWASDAPPRTPPPSRSCKSAATWSRKTATERHATTAY